MMEVEVSSYYDRAKFAHVDVRTNASMKVFDSVFIAWLVYVDDEHRLGVFSVKLNCYDIG